MSETPKPVDEPEKNLASRLRKMRDKMGLSLDEVAVRAKISKTYLWELEGDTEGLKKPSAAVLMQIASALSTTLADVLSLERVRIQDEVVVEVPPSLQEFRDRMANQNTPLSIEDFRDLAGMKFRGAQPQTADDWHQLFLVLANSVRRRKI